MNIFVTVTGRADVILGHAKRRPCPKQEDIHWLLGTSRLEICQGIQQQGGQVTPPENGGGGGGAARCARMNKVNN